MEGKKRQEEEGEEMQEKFNEQRHPEKVKEEGTLKKDVGKKVT
jgi:hypothetical protein